MVRCLNYDHFSQNVVLLLFKKRLEFSTELPKLQLVYAHSHLKDIKMLTSSSTLHIVKVDYYPGFCAGK